MNLKVCCTCSAIVLSNGKIYLFIVFNGCCGNPVIGGNSSAKFVEEYNFEGRAVTQTLIFEAHLSVAFATCNEINGAFLYRDAGSSRSGLIDCYEI